MRIITLNDDEALLNYAQPIVAKLRVNMVRVDADFSATPPVMERGALLREFPWSSPCGGWRSNASRSCA